MKLWNTHFKKSFFRCPFSTQQSNAFDIISIQQQKPTNILQNHQTYYKRPLSNKLIAFASEQGKRIFKTALDEGNMESYFKLAEQFITQLEPSTCGTTSLSMILNALEIDPQRQWKGIWRWYSEENLYCLNPEYINMGISLEDFSELARCNQIQTLSFFHKNSMELQKGRGTRLFKHTHEKTCTQLGESRMKYSSYNTFKSCILASSRRDGLYLVLNSSRKALQQTGDGHYSPLGGYCQAQDLGLVLDVARFKYPSYWCSTQLLYDSFSNIDQNSGLTRGYSLMSRGFYNQQTQIPKISQDLTSIKALHSDLINGYFYQRITQQQTQQQQNSIQTWFQQFCYQLNLDFNVLLCYYLYHFEIRLQYNNNNNSNNNISDTNQLKKGSNLVELISTVNQFDFTQKIHNLRKFTKNQGILEIIHDFCQDSHVDCILTLIILALPVDILHQTTKIFQCPEIMQDLVKCKQYILSQHLSDILNEIEFFKEVFGWYNTNNLSH